MKVFAGIPPGTRPTWLSKDLLAGLTVWAVLIPEALAYATIAGVPPVVGFTRRPPHSSSTRSSAARAISWSARWRRPLRCPRRSAVANLGRQRLHRPDHGPRPDRGRDRAHRRTDQVGVHRVVHLRTRAQGLHHRPGSDDHHRASPEVDRRTRRGWRLLRAARGGVRPPGRAEYPDGHPRLAVSCPRPGPQGGGPRIPAALVAVAIGIGATALLGLEELGVDIVGPIDEGLPTWARRPQASTSTWPSSGRRSVSRSSGSPRVWVPPRRMPLATTTTSTRTRSSSASAQRTSDRG